MFNGATIASSYISEWHTISVEYMNNIFTNSGINFENYSNVLINFDEQARENINLGIVSNKDYTNVNYYGT